MQVAGRGCLPLRERNRREPRRSCQSISQARVKRFSTPKRSIEQAIFLAMVEARQEYPGMLADVGPDPLGHNSYRLPSTNADGQSKRPHKKVAAAMSPSGCLHSNNSTRHFRCRSACFMLRDKSRIILSIERNAELRCQFSFQPPLVGDLQRIHAVVGIEFHQQYTARCHRDVPADCFQARQ